MHDAIKLTKIEYIPEKTLFGLRNQLSVDNARERYHRVWTNFLNRLKAGAGTNDSELYGVCANLKRDGSFDYWTAATFGTDAKIPPDFSLIPLWAGPYGSQVIKAGQPLPFVYGRSAHIWNIPPRSSLNWRQPFFERYLPGWSDRTELKICVPLHIGRDQRTLALAG
jgi:predicted transcriptional regulator YdeE